MNEIFFVRNIATQNKYRCIMESENTYFVFKPRKRRYGWRYTKDDFFAQYEIIPQKLSETEKWHKNINKAITKIQKSGLWYDKLPMFENLLNMTYEDHQSLRECYFSRYSSSDEKEDYGFLLKQYPFAFNDDGFPKFEYISEVSDCILKSMYFGTWNKRVKEDIAKHIAMQQTYCIHHLPVNYDVSFDYDPKKQKAWYSEEYRGCANGHYYLAIDENTAIFCEND